MVINPSFEAYSNCPFTVGTLSDANNWNQGNLGSCDYHSACNGGTFVGVPLNFQGYQHAYSGSSYASGYFYQPNSNNREYLKGTISNMIPNAFYEVEIHVSLSNSSRFAISNIGVFFFQNGLPVSTNNFSYISVTPQIDYSGSGIHLDTMNWITLTDVFYADSAYTQFLIGNFLPDSLTNSLLVNPNGTHYLAYYYIDSIIVKPIGPFPPLTATTAQINNQCYNGTSGSVSALPTGGMQPYSYLWQPGNYTTQAVNNLAAGSYTCTITDFLNNAITQTVTITQPSTPFVASVINTVTPLCGQQNGSISVSVSGGAPGYTYSWSPYGGTTSIGTGLGAGTYTCTVTDAIGCTVTVSDTLPLAGAFSTTPAGTNPDCFGTNTGSAIVTPIGGTSPFTYLWSNGQTTQTASNLAAGTYTVTVTDANRCTGSVTVTLTQPPQLTASITS
ncbi:MAG TPA: SprB repeat-containing protein, partial [Flavipsychrobacter sp.]|nr:SprB repeat-containing protein [Flavipsychrobacter sp.]